ncbi:MAG: fumarate reductase subunit C [Aliiglaciecola sp.]|uniref:fumarate reductase subunit C n=1 Tax=Aliiglaciecola sp. TaxID=1872441 RepID=UPI003299F48F
MTYHTSLSRTWWLKHNAFKAYMLREATVLPLTFFILCLVSGIFSLWQGESQWLNWQVAMAQPWVLVINLIALMASLFHAWTFFVLFPRVMPIRIGEITVPANLLVAGQWAGVFSVIILFFWLFWGNL